MEEGLLVRAPVLGTELTPVPVLVGEEELGWDLVTGQQGIGGPGRQQQRAEVEAAGFSSSR